MLAPVSLAQGSSNPRAECHSLRPPFHPLPPTNALFWRQMRDKTPSIFGTLLATNRARQGKIVRIIIIEDDYYIFQDLSRLLEAEGFTTHFHTNIADAVRSLLAEDFDLMLLDYHLPGLKGTDALPIIQEVSPRLPVIFMVHETTPEDREMALRAGAFCLLKKPINHRTLLRAIRSAHQSPPVNKAKGQSK